LLTYWVFDPVDLQQLAPEVIAAVLTVHGVPAVGQGNRLSAGKHSLRRLGNTIDSLHREDYNVGNRR